MLDNRSKWGAVACSSLVGSERGDGGVTERVVLSVRVKHALVYTPPTHLLHAPGHALDTHPPLHGAVLIEAREQFRVGTCRKGRALGYRRRD